ncbi:MAG: cysteine desulfurase [Myxococcota bacterium]|jgi:cysteine desulfurase
MDIIGVDPNGDIRVADIPARAGLISVMAANHETGVIHDLAAVCARARQVGAFVHVDAVQAVARIHLDLTDVDAVVLSAHKMGGPPGVGCAVLSDGEPFPALLTGGAQERGRRAGTVNVAGVVGFGAACAAALRDRAARAEHSKQLARRLRIGLDGLGARQIGGVSRLDAVTCVVFPGVAGEAIVQALDLRGICVSHGAACSSGSLDPSPVLLAMADSDPSGGVRFSTGFGTTDADIEATLLALSDLVPLLVDAWDE